MNWLAHVFLSEANVEQRLGNLLADLVRGADRAAMSAEFLLGVRRHQAIDSYTDAHPVVRRSRTRIGPEHRRFSGVLVDVFYDYFLASSWGRYSSQPLADFTAGFYADVGRARSSCRNQRASPSTGSSGTTCSAPTGASMASSSRCAVCRCGWTRAGAGTSHWKEQSQICARTKSDLADDFAAFFPELQAHVATVAGPGASRWSEC